MTAEAPSRPLLLGHRGCRLRGIPENTHQAFAHALAAGCDGFEFDVRLTSDRVSVCLHDSAVGNMDIQSYTYGQISKEYFKNHPREPASREPIIPTLPEIMETYSNTAFLNIELKVEGLERTLLQLLEAHPPAKGYVVSSFIPEIICDLAELASSEPGVELELGYLFDNVTGLHDWSNMPGPWVVPRYDLVTRPLVDSVHEAGRKLLTWTVNRPADMVRLRDWGVDGLISDDPVLLRRTVRGG